MKQQIKAIGILKVLLVLLIPVQAVYSQQRMAILNTEDDGEPSLKATELNYLTDRLREHAGEVLKGRYGIMTQESIVDKLGSREKAAKACKEASCLADLGKKLNADYIAQGRIGRFGGNLTIKVELYKSASGLLVATFTGFSKDLTGLLGVLDEKAPDLFKKMMGGSAASVFEGGISGLQSGAGYEGSFEKRRVANIATEPAGAVLSFDGAPDSRCARTPCKIELAEGDVRIVASLDRYEKADTVVSIAQNNQSVIIKLKSSFGVFEVKPAYLEGIGAEHGWAVYIGGKASSLSNKLSPGKYKIELKNRCYEDLSFDAGINKGSHEVFDMVEHVRLKQGGLILSAEQNGEPVTEPVYVNGARVGETPFSGTVPLCAKIAIGNERQNVPIALKHNDNVKHVVRHVESVGTGGKGNSISNYRTKTIGAQVWMAENLNYAVAGSKCGTASYTLTSDDTEYCDTYGRLYNWSTAMALPASCNSSVCASQVSAKHRGICPQGWHIPSGDDWNVLIKFIHEDNGLGSFTSGTSSYAGRYLKATTGWSNCSASGSGYSCLDSYGFAALPGGFGNSGGSFDNAGDSGNWWSSSEDYANIAYYRYMTYSLESAGWLNYGKTDLHSVRCLQD